ncbi:hypothetical protein BN1708_008207, partial [Verticillium longisporum]
VHPRTLTSNSPAGGPCHNGGLQEPQQQQHLHEPCCKTTDMANASLHLPSTPMSNDLAAQARPRASCEPPQPATGPTTDRTPFHRKQSVNKARARQQITNRSKSCVVVVVDIPPSRRT